MFLDIKKILPRNGLFLFLACKNACKNACKKIFENKNGAIFWVHTKISHHSKFGVYPLYYVCLITKQKKIRNRLTTRTKASKAND